MIPAVLISDLESSCSDVFLQLSVKCNTNRIIRSNKFINSRAVLLQSERSLAGILLKQLFRSNIFEKSALWRSGFGVTVMQLLYLLPYIVLPFR